MASQSIIEVDKLSKRFGDKAAVDEVSFEMRRGEVFGFLGPNGAGKTTTIKMLTTLLPPTSGSARVVGRDLRTEGKKIRERIGVVQQQDSFDQGLNVETSMDIYGLIWDVPKRDRRRRIDEVVKRFGMKDFLKMPTIDLSSGQRRRLQVAREFLHDMELLFLDEPTVGLDPLVRRGILDYFKEKVKEGLSIFFTTHILEDSGSDEVSKLIQDEVGGTYRVTTSRPEIVIPEIYRLAEKYGLSVSSIYIAETTLEDAFINLVTVDDVRRPDSS